MNTRIVFLASIAVWAALSVSRVEAQGTGTSTATTASRTSTTGTASGSNAAAGTSAAAGAGTQLQDQGLFSAAGSAGQIGNAQTRFSGSQLATQPLATGGTSSATGISAQQLSRLGTLSTASRLGGRGQAAAQPQSTGRSIRPSLRLGFVPMTRPGSEVTRLVADRLVSLSNRVYQISDTRPEFSAIAVDVADGGLVTLRGTVPSPEAGRLAAHIIRMETGVRRVDNQLEVAATP